MSAVRPGSGQASGRLRSTAAPLGVLLLLASFVRFLPGLVQPHVAQEDCDAADAVTRASLDTLERCAAQRADDVELLLNLGDRLEQTHQPARAEAVYRQASRIDPRDGELHVRIARLLLERGDADNAAAEGRLALELQPRNPIALDLVARAGARK